MKPIRNIEKANKILKRFSTSRVTPMNVLNFYCKYCCPYADKHQFNPRRAYSCTDIHYELDKPNTADNNSMVNDNTNSTTSNHSADTTNTTTAISICPVAIVKQQIYTAIRNNTHISKNDTTVSSNTDTPVSSNTDTPVSSIDMSISNPNSSITGNPNHAVSVRDTIAGNTITATNSDNSNSAILDNPAADTVNNSIVDEILSFFKR